MCCSALSTMWKNAGGSSFGPLGAGDHRIKASYGIDTMSARASKTVKFRYSRP